MTKKDYRLIADAINKVRPGMKHESFTVANQLARDLQNDNPRFDYKRFMKACGFTEEDGV